MTSATGLLLLLLRVLTADPNAPTANDHAADTRAEDTPSWIGIARAPAHADTHDDFVVAPPEPVEGCEAWLDAAGVTFERSQIPVHPNRAGTITCGAEQVVRYVSGPGGIRWSGRPRVTCALALSMARFELVVQEEARRHFGRPVTRVHHLGTYNCREMANYPGWVSEHSYANAIDLERVVLQGGREHAVLGHYGDGVTPTDDPAARFMRAIAQRAYDEDVFSVVVTPAFDRLHRNHLHFDLARYRVDGSRSE